MLARNKSMKSRELACSSQGPLLSVKIEDKEIMTANMFESTDLLDWLPLIALFPDPRDGNSERNSCHTT
jgi:hypothetical protein